ncbi:hypothetical protein DFH94DRAFT_742814 [Russula ochroleuca]|uniref:Uncharacterized protein n=1 Tax=Russula ochroleuca TaxID=152965 RepID=A0A9P5MWM4_9AGAM|nr:hypothetical protein DFH94DRAFT_742814 [Russula ochroleuca]
MILTTLFAYATPLFPSAQVWCGDRYLEAVHTLLREHNSAFDTSQHESIQLQILRATEMKSELDSKWGITKRQHAYEYSKTCRDVYRFTQMISSGSCI